MITEFNLIYFLRDLYYTQSYQEKILTNYIILVIMTILIYWFVQQIKKGILSSNIWIIIYCVFSEETSMIFKSLLLKFFIMHLVINILITKWKKKQKRRQEEVALNNDNNNISNRRVNVRTKKSPKRN